MNPKKLAKAAVGGIGGFILLLFLVPMVVVVGTVVTPFAVIGEFVDSIGDVLFDGNGQNDVIMLINNYLEYGDGYDLITDDYRPVILGYREQTLIPLNWLFVPNVMAGIEHPTEEQFQQQIDCILIDGQLSELEDYLKALQQIEPYKEAFKNISVSTLQGYVNEFKNLNIFGSLDSDWLKEHQGEWIYPFDHYVIVTAKPGWYTPFGKKEWHSGTDFGAGCGTPIYAVRDGEVIAMNGNDWQTTGAFVRTRSEDGLIIEYWHMNTKWLGNLGDQIKAGDLIGYVGSTGKSTGCHLHLGIHDADANIIGFCDLYNCEDPELPEITEQE